MELTKIELQKFDSQTMQTRAAAIRQAVASKAVTPAMVGELFADLIDACGDIRTALALFLDTNVAEIAGNIEARMAGIDAATEAASAETQRTAAMRELVEELTGALQAQAVARPTPTQVVVDYAPKEVTLANGVHPQVKARAVPGYGDGGVLFYGAGQTLMITPDGIITPTAIGSAMVNVVAVQKSTVYKQITIAVVPPRLRMTEGGHIRLDANGNIRLT